MGSSERRRHGRFRPDGLTCNLGDVVDLSLTGARILGRRERQGVQAIVLHTPRHGEIELVGRVSWRRRLGFREHVLGLAFEGVEGDTLSKLTRVIREIGEGADQHTTAAIFSRGQWVGLVTALLGVALVMLGVGMESPDAAVPRYLSSLALWHGHVFWAGLLGGGLLVLTGLSEMLRGTPRDPQAKGSLRSAAQTGPTASGEDAQDIRKLRSSQHLLNCILESSLGGVAVLKARRAPGESVAHDFEVQLVNRAAETLLGKNESLLVGRSISQALPCLMKHSIFHDLATTVATGMTVQKEYRLDNGRWVQLAVVQLGDGLAVTFADTTEQHHAQARLRHVAYHDELTGLPNRKLLMEHLERALNRTKRFPGHKFAVLFLDFDRFKIVNDTLGHDVGDMLLNSISERLRENIRDIDTAALAGQDQVPARLGGDEFVVMLDGIAGIDDATVVARRLLEAFKRPHHFGNHRVVSTASIGIVVGNRSYNTVDELLRDADTAMYEAKHAGKARYVVFDQHMHESIVAQAKLERDLRDAVANHDFELVYEPIIDLGNGKVSGFEALIRWQHPERGAVPPSQFIPLAEEINIINPIGEWVIQRGCEQLGRWKAMGVTGLFLNVNLSRAQLYDAGLVENIRRQIDEHGIDPAMLSLEITETMVMNDAAEMAVKLRELKTLGVRLALDDFGTGHSSLNVLQMLPLDVLKIDRTFIENAGESVRRYGAIIATITELAKNLDMRVIAEGIERVEQVDLLRSLGCDFAQGWLFSKALSADEAAAMVADPPSFAHHAAA